MGGVTLPSPARDQQGTPRHYRGGEESGGEGVGCAAGTVVLSSGAAATSPDGTTTTRPPTRRGASGGGVWCVYRTVRVLMR